MRIWSGLPLIRLIIPFIGGILCQVYFPVHPLIVYPGLIAGLLWLYLTHVKRLVSYRLHWINGSVYYMLMLAVGMILTGETTVSPDSRISKEGFMVMRIDEPLKATERSYKAIVSLRQMIREGCPLPVSGKAVIYLKKDSLPLAYGDHILTSGKLSEVPGPGNPGEFDYKAYLGRQQIHHQAFLAPGDWVKLPINDAHWLAGSVYHIRNILLQQLDKHLSGTNEKAVAAALILGYKDYLSPDIKKAYAGTGAMHVLAVSGLHVGIIYIILGSLLNFLDKRKRGSPVKTILLIVAIWSYAMITGASPSVLRAATMFSFIVIGKQYGRHTNIYNTLAASAFFLLILDPWLILEVGFQLSYLAVLGIVYLHPRIYGLWQPENWLVEKIWAISAVSIAAQIATFPVGLLYFHQFPTYFLLSNLLVIPAATIILHLGIFLLLISPIDFLANLTGQVLQFTISVLNHAIVWMEELPLALIRGIMLQSWEVILIYVILFMTLLYWRVKRSYALTCALVACFPLAIHHLQFQYDTARQQRIICYQVPRYTAIEFINGKNSCLLVSPELFQKETKMSYHIRQHQWMRDIEATQVVHPNDSISGYRQSELAGLQWHYPFLQFMDKKFAILDSLPRYIQPQQPMALDGVLIRNNPPFGLKHLLQYFHTPLIVIDGSNNSYQLRKWEKACANAGIELYSSAKEGAWQLTLR